MAENRVATPWMPTAGGILSIIAGVMGLLAALALIVGAIVTGVVVNATAPGWAGIPAAVLGILAVWFLIAGVLAVVGGLTALKRRNWGLALTGAIASFFCAGHILAILAIVFIALSRKEFTS